MAIRVDKTANLYVTRDTAQTRVIFGQASAATNRQVLDTFDHAVAGTLNIAASQTESLPLGDVDDVRGVYVRLSGSFNVVFNGGSDTLSFVQVGTDEVSMLLDVSATSVSISNPSGTTGLTGEFCVWGDPTA